VAQSESSSTARHGLFGSLRQALSTLVELLRVRLELVGVDIATAWQHWLNLLMWSMLALFSAFLAIVMLVVSVLIVFWDTHRLLAAGGITAFLALTALIAVLMARRQIRSRPHLLAHTIAELRRDAAALDGKGR
jgi:uncharacterized membrane protein YqjE